MKCLLCTRNFQGKKLLKNHYIAKHKSNLKNWFLKALCEKNKDRFFLRKCYRCEKFLTSRTRKNTQFLETLPKRWTNTLGK